MAYHVKLLQIAAQEIVAHGRATLQNSFAPEILDLVGSGRVQRWHTSPGVPAQRNSEHQWSVAMIILAVWPECSGNLIKAALLHDKHEKVYGDIPRPSMNLIPGARAFDDEKSVEMMNDAVPGLWESLTDEERTVLRMADRLESYLHVAQDVLFNEQQHCKRAIGTDIAGWGFIVAGEKA